MKGTMPGEQKLLEERFLKTLRLVAPGTDLHEGLESIIRARTGALIVVGDSPEVMALVDGGFRLNCEFTPSRLYELCKMDGAVVLSEDGRQILVANAQLLPDPQVESKETGTRHRTAERVAKQTGKLVIAISQRRNVITLYEGNFKYIIRDIGVTLAKANQALQTLEKYRSVLDHALTNLSALEFEDLATLSDVATAIQRTEMVSRVAREIEKYICELGTEGRLISMQLEELMADVEDEGLMVIRDYLVAHESKSAESIRDQIASWDAEDLLDLGTICRTLGYSGTANILDQAVSPRGYRVLSKIPRLPMPVIMNIVVTFKTLQGVLNASIDELDGVEGIGEVRAHAIKDGLRRLREHVLLERHM